MRRWDERLFNRQARLGAMVLGCLALAACSSTKLASTVDPRYGVSTSARVVEYGQPVPKGGGVYKLGPAYTVAGRTYVPEEDVHYRAEGVASWYGADFHGRLTANGEIYDMDGISAAHPTLPMPCYVRVTNLANQKSLVVRVNDRGPYAANREIDVSGKAAELLGFRGHGLARVRVEYVGRAPIEGSDDRVLEATLRQGGPAPAPPGVMVASAGPFIPRPPSAIPMQGEIPLPEDRPFNLGEGAASEVHLPSNLRTAANPAGSYGAAGPVRKLAGPVAQPVLSAYAPVRYDATTGITTGRGLY